MPRSVRHRKKVYRLPIVHKRVGTPFPGDISNALNRNFEYDPLYRVVYGSGRESDTQSGNSYLYADAPAPGTPNANNVRAYERNYAYDKMGNIKSVVQSGSNGFTRAFTYNTGKNTLQKVENATPSIIEDFTYDACGNQTLAGTNRHYVWDHANRLLSYYNQAGGGDPSVFTQYDYSGHDRISKLVRTGTAGSPIYERTIYIDGIFEYHILENGTTYEKNYVHIMDNRTRIAEIRLGTPFPGDLSDAVVYNLEDQIGSSVTRLNTSGAVIDKEEYYPFGDSSLRTFSSKRYRYVGKEKDQESGLYYYGARYYAAWTCRFISVDPLAAKYNYWSSYVHAGNNPIMFVDINGEGPDDGGGNSESLDGSGGGSNSAGQEINLEPSSTWGGDSDIKIANSHQPELQQADQSRNCPAKSATFDYSTEEALAFINDVRSEFKEENRNLLGKWITGKDKKTVGNNNYQPGIVKVLDEILAKNPESKINFTTKRDGLNLPENSDGAMVKTGESSYTVYWNPNAKIEEIGTSPAFEEIFHLYNAITGIAEYTLQDGMWGIWDNSKLLDEEARAKYQVVSLINNISLTYKLVDNEKIETGYYIKALSDFGAMKNLSQNEIRDFISMNSGKFHFGELMNTNGWILEFQKGSQRYSIKAEGSYSYLIQDR